MTETDIQKCLVTTLFHWRRHVCVPNVDFGFLPWEADLVVMRQSGYADEIEIKTTIGDLRADKRKGKHRWPRAGNALRIRQMYYAAPQDVLAKMRIDDIAATAGVISIREIDGKLKAEITRPATALPGARKLTAQEQFRLARLGCIRFWTKQP